MPVDHQALFAESYLWAEFGGEFEIFQGSDEERLLIERLTHWATRELQNETAAQNSFIDRFFKQLWGYIGAGEQNPTVGYTCFPQFAVGRAGATGGTGQADLALGAFGLPLLPPIPQALCEFKDIRSGLDTPQRRKNDTRSPVRQCADYLRESAASLFGNEPVQPHWGIVTDMNEFRLYRRITMPTQYQRFVIAPTAGDSAISLLGEGREASFQRLIFSRLFHVSRLISAGGDPPLIHDLKQQFVSERALEQAFYGEYRAYREQLIEALRLYNPHFPGTRGKLVRLAQTILDRCLFVLFCEDMGRSLSFPPSLLRDYLGSYSTAAYYEPNGEEIWTTLRRLFSVMNAGGLFLNHTINRFNGGLFAVNAELDALHVPNSVFCQTNQGGSPENLIACPRTLLFFSARYNFGSSSDGRVINLYTLGRIFEQSITELEALEADADGRPSLTRITKRKRDGVYYTPETIVGRIVEETIGSRLADLRREANWDESVVFTEADIQRQSAALRRQVDAIDRYRDALERVTVVDPACGSGAFLIHALEYLLRERRRVSSERERLSRRPLLFEQEEQIREILSTNIYGVDINPASVEISRLALWLHTARADRPLCDLDRNVRDGNSLINPDEFRRWDQQMALLPPEAQERINPFDWVAAFPDVFARGGFDCVIGNPPYVKLQNFKRVLPQVAGFLKEARNTDGTPLFQSTQSGSFDVFLPFIERSIRLLNEHGRMGFIAPSLWLLNEYGEGLRNFVHAGRHLDRWIDFKSFQVFEEAITYTALQFFTRAPNPVVRFALAPDGALATDWSNPAWHVPYEELSSGDETWVFLPEAERRILQRFWRESKRLGGLADIVVGIQTSADHIYHLKRIGPGVYENRSDREHPLEVLIEDALMRPLISGSEASRYVDPETDIYLLFPYEVDERGASLISPIQLERDYSQAWNYLCSHEEELRARDNGKNDADDRWWAYVYPKNLDKQQLPKLAVPRLVTDLFCAIDRRGQIFLDNVDVGGVIFTSETELLYVAALLNSPILNFVWRRLSKPFQNDYRSANKQFIAPLPIPEASAEVKERFGRVALELQGLYTRLRSIEAAVQHRLQGCEIVGHGEEWILPDVRSLADWKRQAPAEFGARARTQWAKENRARKLREEMGRLQSRCRRGGTLQARLSEGELLIEQNGVVVIDHVFVTPEEGPFLVAQWQFALLQLGSSDASKIVDLLRNVKRSGNLPLKTQVIELVQEGIQLRQQIDGQEKELNEDIFTLYGVTPEERALIESGN